jgi:hypothetical protein
MYVSSFRTGRWLAPARRSLVYTRVYRILLSPRCTVELVYYCKLEPRVRVCVRGSMPKYTVRNPAYRRGDLARTRDAAAPILLLAAYATPERLIAWGRCRAPTLSRVPAVVNGREVWRRPRRRHARRFINVPPFVPPIATRIRFACISRGLGLLARTRLTTRLTGRVLITGECAPCSYSNGPRVN